MSSENKQTKTQTDALDLVRLRNNFYRDNYRKVMSSLLVCLLTIALLLGVIFYMITHQPEPRYFATSSAGRIVPLTPLRRSNQNDPTILQWANQAVVTAYSIDFDRYRQQLQYASQYFTRGGWNAFIAALKASNNLDAIKTKKLIMHAVATGAPVVINRGLINDRYSWQIQMPVLGGARECQSKRSSSRLW